MLRIQIDLNGVIEHQDVEQKERTAEPGKVPVQESHGFRETLGREPIIFVREINQLWRQESDYFWYRESNYRDKDAYHNQNLEEGLLGLPAIRNTTAVKVGSHDTGQLGINSSEVNRCIEHQERGNQLGQSRIQEGPLRSRLPHSTGKARLQSRKVGETIKLLTPFVRRASRR